MPTKASEPMKNTIAIHRPISRGFGIGLEMVKWRAKGKQFMVDGKQCAVFRVESKRMDYQAIMLGSFAINLEPMGGRQVSLWKSDDDFRQFGDPTFLMDSNSEICGKNHSVVVADLRRF